MPGAIKFSEAASLALHTIALLGGEPDRHVTVREAAKALAVSENHLAKVLQRLAKAGFVESTRGPRGGFVLRANRDETTLLEIYEAIEGPFTEARCLLPAPRCCGRCMFDDVIGVANAMVRERMASTRLSQLEGLFGVRRSAAPSPEPVAADPADESGYGQEPR